MKTNVLTILDENKMLERMVDVLGNVCKDFPQMKKDYEEAIEVLRNDLGDEKVDELICSIGKRCKADMLFCGSLGFWANLSNFRDPVARTFMDVDFEEYLRVGVLQNMPHRSKAENEIDYFYNSLNESQKEIYETISTYLVSLELDLTKLAHYAGFMFANEMLEYIEPGYSPNMVLLLRYQNFMEDWFGAKFKLWYETDTSSEGYNNAE